MNLKRSDRDTELWVMERDDWMLPILVDEFTGNGVLVVRVKAATYLSREQNAAIAETLAPLQHLCAVDGWILTWDTLRASAKRAQGITPERYVRWPDHPAPVVPSESVEARPHGDADDFVQYVHQHFQPAPIEYIRVVWMSICRAIPPYLMSGGMIDMGAIRLGALPFRRHWMRLLLARAQWVRHLYRAPNWAERWRYEAERIVRLLTSGDMIATFGRLVGRRLTTLYRWSVWVEQDVAWEKATTEIEGQHAAALGPRNYLLRWSNLVANGMPLIHRLLREEVLAEGQAAGRIRDGGDGVGLSLGQASPTEIRDGEVVVGGAGSLASPWDFWGADARFQYLERAAGDLLAVPPVLPVAPDVRDAGRDGGA